MSTATLSNAARAWLIALSFITSSVLIHVAVTWPTPLTAYLALLALAFVPTCVGLAERRASAWMAFALAAVIALPLVRYGAGWWVLYLPSLAIPASVAWLFGRTLRRGETPLVVSVARAARPDTPDYLLRYSRSLTWLWTLLFAAMTTWDAALAFLAPRAWWSFTANFGNYLCIGAVVVGEYVYRRVRFRTYAHPGFAEYLSIVARANPRRAHRR
jgi:uncharacterized membrane protein